MGCKRAKARKRSCMSYFLLSLSWVFTAWPLARGSEYEKKIAEIEKRRSECCY